MKKIALIIMTFIFISITTFCDQHGDWEKTINYMGNQVCYEIRGKGPKTLFFIHGWTGSRETWKYQLDAFDDYRVIAIDLPGNGKSGKNEKVNYTMDLFADTIYEILKKENINNAFFIGHSMGFAVAEVMACKYPEICKGIGSVDGAHFELPEEPVEKEAWIQYNREFAKSMENEQGRKDFINALFLPDTPQILKDEVFKISSNVPLTIGKSMIEGVESSQNYWKKRIMNIPCLAIYSPAYQLTPKDKADFINMYPLVEYHEIEKVSHFFMLEIPYKVNQILLDYLSKAY
ncbi:MAG TPA: alpha/beta hydrolase [bacterium]|nr:alpha/beta hydrolase [bacterium]HPN46094.1 alpha/beta hydrolase [bacterium]